MSATTQSTPAAATAGASDSDGRGTATSASRGAVSSAKPAGTERDVAIDALRDAAFELGPTRRRIEVALRDAARRRRRVAASEIDVDDRQPSGAPAEVRGERAVDVEHAVVRPFSIRLRGARR